jgi:co-chaperonin GroES (HSP10)
MADSKGIGHVGFKAKVEGTILPIRDNVFVTDMNFDDVRTASGLYIPSDDGKDYGIKPRWGRVYAVGPKQTEVKVGEWILIEHGRWTRAITLVEPDGTERKIFRVDTNCMLLSADEKPNDLSWGLKSIDLSPPEYDFHPA